MYRSWAVSRSTTSANLVSARGEDKTLAKMKGPIGLMRKWDFHQMKRSHWLERTPPKSLSLSPALWYWSLLLRAVTALAVTCNLVYMRIDASQDGVCDLKLTKHNVASTTGRSLHNQLLGPLVSVSLHFLKSTLKKKKRLHFPWDPCMMWQF